MLPNVVIIDYGLGNLLSVKRAIEHLGATATVTSDPEIILSATHVILPGVGAFPTGMNKLKSSGLDIVVKEVAFKGSQLLTICLGMQLIMQESNEFGKTLGLGLLDGRVEEIPKFSTDGDEIKVPHIGWNSLQPNIRDSEWEKSPLSDLQAGDFVYFVHSYMVHPLDERIRLAHSIYGGHKIVAVISKDNITGCQFHPEKSGPNGLKILNTFITKN